MQNETNSPILALSIVSSVASAHIDNPETPVQAAAIRALEDVGYVLIGRIDTVPVNNSQVRDVLARVENNNGDVDVILVDPQGRAQHKGLN